MKSAVAPHPVRATSYAAFGRMTGIRLWIGAMNSFGVQMITVQVRSGISPSRSRRFHKPARWSRRRWIWIGSRSASHQRWSRPGAWTPSGATHTFRMSQSTSSRMSQGHTAVASLPMGEVSEERRSRSSAGRSRSNADGIVRPFFKERSGDHWR